MEGIKTEFEKLTSKKSLAKLLSADKQLAENFRKVTGSLYQLYQSNPALTNHQALKQLLIDTFDDEQIWQQIDLQNEHCLENLRRVVQAEDDGSSDEEADESIEMQDEDLEGNSEEDDDDELLREVIANSKYKLSDEEASEEESLAEMDNDDGEEGEDEGKDEDVDEDVQMDDNEEDDENKEDLNDDDESAEDDDGDENAEDDNNDPIGELNIDELEKFLDEQDAKEEAALSTDRTKANDEINYFSELESDEEDARVRQMKYDDYFKGAKKRKRPKERDEGEDEMEEASPEEKSQPSTFEKRQERLKKQIESLEEAALEEKPWQLMGEATAKMREVNSLLEEDLDFEHQTRQAPVITEVTTKTLEELIIKRIKDKAFDDVERKIKPKEDVFEYKKRITLDQEKSKLSLAQIYEKEYLDQAKTEDDVKEDPQKKEIKTMMQTLFIKLDALSNYHYVPKMAAPEMKVIKNQKAITLEEVQPVTFTDADALAPEEIKTKEKRDVKADTEQTKTDRNRRRRHKKKKQQQMFKFKKDKLVKKTKQTRGDDEKMTSSKFFKQLQEEVKQDLKQKKTENRTHTKDFIALKL